MMDHQAAGLNGRRFLERQVDALDVVFPTPLRHHLIALPFRFPSCMLKDCRPHAQAADLEYKGVACSR